METKEGGREAPTTLPELINWLNALSPIDRAKAAGDLLPRIQQEAARTAVAVAAVRRAAIYEETRRRPNADVAADLGVSRQAVGKAITEHRRTAAAGEARDGQ